ncbi:hypothetical protein, partial [Paraburkholderia mimosarum]|uniref:hypothetical protein n=1 Tax=Paraburkholderia mimosarum TaxID=312026 RepID=UPI00056C992F
FRIDAIEFRCPDQAVNCSGALTARVRASEQVIPASDGKLALILPISGRKLKSIIVGIRYMVAGSRFATSKNAAVVAWFMSKPAPG